MTEGSDTETDGLTGKILIATPAIGDPRFARTLVFVCTHSHDHAMGLVVNKPMGSLRLPDLLGQLHIATNDSTPDRPVLNGGPVERDRGFVLHSNDYHCEEATLAINKQVAMTATKDVLMAIASPEAPRQSVLALGYTGWGAGQLDSEIVANAWLTCEPSDDLLFGLELGDKWVNALASIGVSPEKLSSFQGQA